MLKPTLSGYETVAILLMLSAGCAHKDSTHIDPTVNGGTGGTPESGGSGGAGQPAGSSGAAGSGGAVGSQGGGGGMPDAGLPRFRATLEGESVSLIALDPVWVEGCQRNPLLVQRSGESWVLLRDERPEADNLQRAAHYLDGSYHSDCSLSLGCDVPTCEPFPADHTFDSSDVPLVAREFVQVGQTAAATCGRGDAGIDLDAGSDAGERLVPNIESHAASGPLGVRIRYYRDNRCETEAITTDIPVE